MKALGQVTRPIQDPFESCLQLDDDETVMTEIKLLLDSTPPHCMEESHSESPYLTPFRIDTPPQTQTTHHQTEYLDTQTTTTSFPTPDIEFREITCQTPNKILSMSIILSTPADSYCSPGESNSKETVASP